MTDAQIAEMVRRFDKNTLVAVSSIDGTAYTNVIARGVNGEQIAGLFGRMRRSIDGCRETLIEEIRRQTGDRGVTYFLAAEKEAYEAEPESSKGYVKDTRRLR
jgi:hypothetical protein